jgi:phosphoglycerate dehydrogenase-like enzyme
MRPNINSVFRLISTAIGIPLYFYFKLKRKFDEIKVLVTRNIPVLGVEMLRKEGFSVTAWPYERPMTDQELIAESKKHNVILCVSADNIGTHFINSCSHLEMISQFAVGYDNIDVPCYKTWNTYWLCSRSNE